MALASVDGRDDRHVTERPQRLGQRVNALRSVPVVVGDENASASYLRLQIISAALSQSHGVATGRRAQNADGRSDDRSRTPE